MPSLPPAPNRKSSRLVFTEKQVVKHEDFNLGNPGPGEVVVEAARTLMSTGTENIVFNRLFEPGTHWDQWVKYPFYPGYAFVGRVTSVGAGVEASLIGTRVACRAPHASHVIKPADECFAVPDQIPWDEALWFAFAKIAFMGALAANYSIGQTSLIVGVGPIGQMSVRWAEAHGVSAIAVDSVQSRLELAKQGGAAGTVKGAIDQVKDQILSATGGTAPDVVIDSTGNSAVFASALSIAKTFGTVVILGDTGAPAKQALTADVITRGLTIRGAHDIHNSPKWNDRTISDLYFRLLLKGRFNAKGLISHRFSPEQCQSAYHTANTERGSTMGIAFDWTDIGT